jgi:endonuclease/exonuclease/phosphatase family metal-dependent hydrolase
LTPQDDFLAGMIRVMTFNLRTAGADDGLNRWDQRRELAIARIRAFSPDLVGLQEIHGAKQAPDLRAALPDYQFLGIERGGPGDAGHEIAAVLVRSGAFEVLSERHFWVSRTPDVPASRSWGSAYVRTAAFVHLRRRAGGFELLLANTHLDYTPCACREGARCLRRELDALPPDLPIIVTGDFNAAKSRLTAYHDLLGSASARPLVDVLRARPGGLPPGGEGTFHAFGKLNAGQAIDWVLASPQLAVVDAGIDRSAQPPLYPSDHYPLWVILEE